MNGREFYIREFFLNKRYIKFLSIESNNNFIILQVILYFFQIVTPEEDFYFVSMAVKGAYEGDNTVVWRQTGGFYIQE